MGLGVNNRVIRQLSCAVLCGEHSLQGICRSLSECLALTPELVEPLAREIYQTHQFSAYPRLAQRFLENSLRESPVLNTLSRSQSLRVVKWPLEKWGDQRVSATNRWNLPELSNELMLAHFLEITPEELTWFSGRYKNHNVTGKQCHYYYRYY